MKMKTIHMTIKPKQVKVANPMHLDAQQRFRACVYKPKKGKGSFNRRTNNKIDY